LPAPPPSDAPSVLDDEIRAIIHAETRIQSEINTGFSIVGAQVLRALAPGANCKVSAGFDEIEVIGDANSTLVQFADGYGVCFPVFQGFVGMILIEDGKVISLAYTPSKRNGRFSEQDQAEVKRRRAFAAVAMRHGYFRVDPNSAKYFAGFVRQFKSADPMLGLYAAYAYSQAGLGDDVLSVYRYLVTGGEPVLFDVALFARKLADAKSPRVRIVPFCPVLRQSWDAISAFKVSLHPVMDLARSHLLPGLWTTFDATGVDSLIRATQEGQLK
jgi:hypothetical protein